MNNDHTAWMHRAFALARRAEGMTRPNPPVGAVVVRNGKVVGEGYHRKAGGPHAEVYALKQAGSKARGATIYVTLEPCSTYGRTPPCALRVIEAGVREVVWSVVDPNPKHAGRAERMFRKHSIRVVKGVCEADGKALLAPFTKWIMEGRPYVTLKLATTLDGRIADRHGNSKWITGPESRAEVQALRRRADAILVGSGTVIADNPSLWPRPDKGRRPWRVVLDPSGRTSPRAKLYTDEHAPHTLVALGKKVDDRTRAAYTRNGAETITVPSGRTAAVRAVLRELAKRGVIHVLCEGGGDLAESLIRADLVDEYAWFIAPRIMGGEKSVAAVRGPGWTMKNLPPLQFVEQRRVGDDLLIRAVPK